MTPRTPGAARACPWITALAVALVACFLALSVPRPTRATASRNVLAALQAEVARGEEEGREVPEYLQGYLWWYRQRADRNGWIDPKRYERAYAHRAAMDRTGRASGRAVAAWSFQGPRNLDRPDRIYFGDGVVSGRVNGAAISPTQGSTYYIATAGGGFWKSTDRGNTWVCKSDKPEWKNVSTSSVAAVPGGTGGKDVVFVGTGDFDGSPDTAGRTRVNFGHGIMRSLDGGDTWTEIGASALGTEAVKAIVPYPDDPDRVLVATGRGGGTQNGVWILTGARGASPALSATSLPAADWSDLAVGARFPDGRRCVYAVGHDFGGQVWRSLDRGATWTPLSPPLRQVDDQSQPLFQQGLDLATSPTQPGTVYLLAPTDQQIWKSTDSGATWASVKNNFPNDNGNPFDGWDQNWSQPQYDAHITCHLDTNNGNDVVYVGLVDLVASWDGGASWSSIGYTYYGPPSPHSARTHNDQHCMAIDPNNPGEMIYGNDGGIYRLTYNPTPPPFTDRWTFTNTLNRGLGITQFIHLAVQPGDTSRMVGGTQDNGSPVASGDLTNWSSHGGGDGGYSAIHPTSPGIQYTTSYPSKDFRGYMRLRVYRTTDGWSTDQQIEGTNWPDISTNVGDMGDSNFYYPIALDPNDPAFLYVGSRYLHRYHDGTNTWAYRLGGIPLAGAGQFITAIAVAPGDSSRVYVGSSDGRVYMSTNTGAGWRRIDPRNTDGSPVFPFVTCISVDPNNKSDVLVGLGGNAGSHLRRCTNTQATTPSWAVVSGPADDPATPSVEGLPAIQLSSVVRDPASASGTWFAGTDVGVFYTRDAGSKWFSLNAGSGTGNFPPCQATSLSIVGRQLFAATYGRGVWRTSIPSPAITITAPINATLAMGGSREITWTAPYVGDVAIEFSRDEGATWVTIIGQTANTGRYTWTSIPGPPGRGYQLRVRSLNDSPLLAGTTTFGVADLLPPTINIVTPTGGVPPAAPPFFRSFPGLSGTATDNHQVKSVYISILGPDGYWDGFHWVPVPETLWAGIRTFPPTPNLSWTETLVPPDNLLRDAQYRVRAYSLDSSDNRSVTGVGRDDFFIKIDQTAPAITLLSPASIVNQNTIPAYSGASAIFFRVTDGTGIGVRPGSVRFQLQRQSDSKFWDGAGWVDGEPVPLPTAQDGTSTSYRSTGTLPGGISPDKGLTHGRYTIRAFASDSLGNPGEISTSFTVEENAPVVTATVPAHLSTVISLPAIRATVRDDGSGLLPDGKVDVTLQRGRDFKFWNGTAWVASTVLDAPRLATSYNSATGVWARASGLPSGIADATGLLGGDYYLRVYATDNVQNVGQVHPGGSLDYARFTVDAIRPVVRVVEPAQDSVLNRLAAMGVSVNDSTGSGVPPDGVKVALQRESDLKYWDASARSWVAAADTLPPLMSTTYNATTRVYARTVGLPAGLSPGAELLHGFYRVRAFATDRTGNVGEPDEGGFHYNRFAIEEGKPVLGITRPTQLATVNDLARFTGTITDGSGSGVLPGSVRLTLQRERDRAFWDGALRRWVIPPAGAAPPQLTAADTTGGWSLTANLPSGYAETNGVRPGLYRVTVTGSDRVGNIGEVRPGFGYVSFRVEESPPTIAIVAPVPSSTVTLLPYIDVNVSDGAGVGIPPTGVTLALQRASDGMYWNGSRWVAATDAAPPLLTAVFNATSRKWRVVTRLAATPDPATGTLGGTYRIYATATDWLGNVGMLNSTGNHVLVAVEQVAPSVSITTPANAASVTRLTAIGGRVVDNTGGAGIDRVEILLFRRTPTGAPLYWNWAGSWVSSPVRTAVRPATASWSKTDALPSALEDGIYYLQAAAFDRAGNSNTANSRFTVGNTAPLRRRTR